MSGCPGPPGPGPSLPGVFFPPGALPFAPAPPARGAGAVNSAAPGAPPPATRIPALGIGIPGIGIPTDPGGSGTHATFLPGPGAPPRAPTATHALFSSTAEEVTQIVGSSGGTHHALGDGHHHHFHRAFGSAHQHFPVPQQPGAPYAYPAYPGSGSQGPTPPALRGPGLPAQNFGALGPAGARIGAAEAPRPSGEQKLEQKLKRKRGKEAKEERRIASDCAKNADDAGSDSIMTGQPGPSEGAPEVSAREKDPRSSGSLGKTGGFGGSVVPKKSRSGRARGKKEDRPKKDQSAADILVSIANA